MGVLFSPALGPRPDLGLIGYQQMWKSYSNCKGAALAPFVSVPAENGQYTTIQWDSIKDHNVKSQRGDGMLPPMMELMGDAGTWACIRHSLRKGIDLDNFISAPDWSNKEIVTVDLLTNQLIREHERLIVAAANAGTYNAAAGSTWASSTTIEAELATGVQSIVDGTYGLVGGSDLHIAIDYKTAHKLSRNTNIQTKLGGAIDFKQVLQAAAAFLKGFGFKAVHISSTGALSTTAYIFARPDPIPESLDLYLGALASPTTNVPSAINSQQNLGDGQTPGEARLTDVRSWIEGQHVQWLSPQIVYQAKLVNDICLYRITGC